MVIACMFNASPSAVVAANGDCCTAKESGMFMNRGEEAVFCAVANRGDGDVDDGEVLF